jgi:hypothetical protein
MAEQQSVNECRPGKHILGKIFAELHHLESTESRDNTPIWQKKRRYFHTFSLHLQVLLSTRSTNFRVPFFSQQREILLGVAHLERRQFESQHQALQSSVSLCPQTRHSRQQRNSSKLANCTRGFLSPRWRKGASSDSGHMSNPGLLPRKVKICCKQQTKLLTGCAEKSRNKVSLVCAILSQEHRIYSSWSRRGL